MAKENKKRKARLEFENYVYDRLHGKASVPKVHCFEDGESILVMDLLGESLLSKLDKCSD